MKDRHFSLPTEQDRNVERLRVTLKFYGEYDFN